MEIQSFHGLDWVKSHPEKFFFPTDVPNAYQLAQRMAGDAMILGTLPFSSINLANGGLWQRGKIGWPKALRFPYPNLSTKLGAFQKPVQMLCELMSC